MSTSSPLTPLAPKRRRGHLRVAAILEAAEEVFAEKGFEAATMTEIAARSKTAIGSLYRFFPNKEVLAEALAADYVGKVREGLGAIEEKAHGMSARQLAEALVDYRMRMKEHRRVVFLLLEARGGLREKRGGLGGLLRAHLITILRTALHLDQAGAERMARLTEHLVRLVNELSPDEQAVAADVTDLLEVYFTKRG